MAERPKLNIHAEAFAAPPPGAPRQTTTPGSEQPTPDQLAKARANERELDAFAPKPMTREQMVAMLGEDKIQEYERAGTIAFDADGQPTSVTAPAHVHADGIHQTPAAERPVTTSMKGVDVPLRKVRRPGESLLSLHAQKTNELPVDGIQGAQAPEPPTQQPQDAQAPEHGAAIVAPPAPEPDVIPPQPPPPAAYQPAASDTDTPSRGLPKAIADPGKQITGGFGDFGEAAYVPLDGLELKALVESLMDVIHARLQDDLRFSMAVTYPRVTARVVIEVKAYADDQSFQIVKIAAPPHKVDEVVKGNAPEKIARAHADEICFVVVAERQEMTDAGESVAPPNATRLELGLQIPQKRRVQTPSGGIMVDLTS